MQAPKLFWWVGGIGLVWNLIGVAAFVGQMTMDVTTLPPAERDFYLATPEWATAAFAIAVFAGVFGCFAMLLRQPWAVAVLAASLAGIVVQIGHSIFIGNGLDIFGAAGLVLPLLTLTIAIALFLFASHAKKQGWLART